MFHIIVYEEVDELNETRVSLRRPSVTMLFHLCEDAVDHLIDCSFDCISDTAFRLDGCRRACDDSFSISGIERHDYFGSRLAELGSVFGSGDFAKQAAYL